MFENWNVTMHLDLLINALIVLVCEYSKFWILINIREDIPKIRNIGVWEFEDENNYWWKYDFHSNFQNINIKNNKKLSSHQILIKPLIMRINFFI